MASDQNATNPFASPPTTEEAVKVVPGAFDIQGERILGTGKIVLPHACVKCGEKQAEQDTSTRRKKDLYWVHPAIFVLVIQLLIFLIVYLATRKKCHVEYSFCRACNAKQRMNTVYCVGALATFIGMIALLINFENPWFLVGVLISFVAMLAFAIRGNGPLAIKAYKRGEFHVRGASPAFLQFAESYAVAQAVPATVLAEDGHLA
ncbi:hypothetical protein [Bremerella alba]|nr:hypothetical protein [Bremerella alba]